LNSKRLTIGAILPHLLIFGGVRRYIELGNELIKRGHEMIIYTEAGEDCKWLRFEGKVSPFSEITNSAHDVMVTGTPEYLDLLLRSDSKVRIFYVQLERLKDEKKIVSAEGVEIMVNSSGLARRMRRKYHIEPLDGIGGVNTSMFFPQSDASKVDNHPSNDGKNRKATNEGVLRVLCYGRLSRPRKGTRFVVEAVRNLFRRGYRVELNLFDSMDNCSNDPRVGFAPGVPFKFYMNLPQSLLVDMYNAADVFVSSEHRAGWSNTAAEAAASGLPLVTTKSGSEDFAIDGETALVVPFRHSFFIERALKRLYRDAEMRRRLGEKAAEVIKKYSWDKVAEKVERQFLQLVNNS